MDKICPIFFAGTTSVINHCIDSTCAWFLNSTRSCAIPVIAGALVELYVEQEEKHEKG